MDEFERAHIRVFLNDPAGRGDALAPSAAPRATERGPWGFRVEGHAPAPRAYAPDTPEFLYWQLASALERGKRFWAALAPRPGEWIPGPTLPAIPNDGEDLNAFYDRRALHFFRAVDAKTGAIVQSAESPDVVTHEQGHAILDAVRPDLWDAPHFEVAAFHEAFGDCAAIFVALARQELAGEVVHATNANPARSNLVSRLAEELGAAVRDRYGRDAALPGALRDAVNTFEYVDPKSLPDSAPARALSAEPHSFSRVMTGAVWDVLVAIFRAMPGEDRASALSLASDKTARVAIAAAETAPSGADFFGRVARRIVREARGLVGTALASEIADGLFRRHLLASPDVPADLAPDEDPGVLAPPEGAPASPALTRAIHARLGPAGGGEVILRAARDAAPARARTLYGRRKRDLFLRGPEYGPADGAAVEISDSFALGFGEAGFLTASRFHPAANRDEDDARAFVRFLARRQRIAGETDARRDSRRLAADGKSHAVVRDDDGVRRLRRIWISRKESP